MWTPNAAAGSITLTYTSDPTATTTIQVKANATASEVAAAINGTGAAPVSASVIKDAAGNERLILSARKTGQASAFTVSASGLAAGQMTEDTTYRKTGATLDAQYRLNGSNTVLTSPTNDIENAVPGVRLTLKSVTGNQFIGVTVGAPAQDLETVKTKVKAFVDAYNAVVSSTRSKISEKTVADASTSADAAKGQLFGDTGLLSMLSSLRVRMGERVTGDLNDLADLGIAVPKATGAATQDARDGKLAIDDEKLTAALTADATKVKETFASFADALGTYINTQTGTTGVLDGRARAADGDIKRIDAQVARAEERLEAKEKRLKAQFAAMESALLNAQSQGAWLSGQLASLSA